MEKSFLCNPCTLLTPKCVHNLQNPSAIQWHAPRYILELLTQQSHPYVDVNPVLLSKAIKDQAAAQIRIEPGDLFLTWGKDGGLPV